MALVPPDKALIERLPLPLAQLYRRAANAKTPLERHQAAYYWWEASLKLLASTAVVTYSKLPEQDDKLQPLLAAFARPQIGQWWAIARELTRAMSSTGDAGFQKVSAFLFSDRRDDLPHLAGLDAALADVPARSVVRPADVFDHLVAYRNKLPGHGAIGMHLDAHYERMAMALRAGMEELFRHLDPVAGRQLIYIRDVKQSASRWLVERFALHGESPEAKSGLDLPRDIGSELPHDNRVYLQASADESAAGLTALHPFALFDFDSCRFSFWNSRRGPMTVQYLCYTTGEVVNVTADESVGMLPVGADAEGNAPSVETTNSGRPTLGEFALLSELGRGGMGIVYRAWQPSLRREVALKTLLRVGDATADGRFRREIRALGKVDHPNLVKVHTSGADGDRWFYAMELVEGASLAAIAQKLSASGVAAGTVDGANWQAAVSTACDEAREAEKPLSGSPQREQGKETNATLAGAAGSRNPNYIDQITDLIRQAAEAANALHESGVVHRDIKPGNILIDDAGAHAVLMDLGLAQLEDDAEAMLTKTRQFLGTPRYASPEHVLGVSRLDRRSDVYSLGATLWEMLALRPIFDADDSLPTNQVFERIQRDEPERLRRINRAVSRDLEAVVHKCLEKNPKARYATAGEFAADLRRSLNREPVTARPVSGTTRTLKWLRRRPAIAAALALGLVLLVGGVVGTIVFSVKSRQLANANVALEDSLAKTKAARNRTREALDAMVSEVTGDSLATQKELSAEQKKFLESVVGYYEEFAAEPGEDREGRERLAKALNALGIIRNRLGHRHAAVPLYERSAQMYSTLASEFPDVSAYRESLAANQNNLGTVFNDLGQQSSAEAAHRSALAIREKLATDFPDVPKHRQGIAQSHGNLGRVLGMLGKRHEAELSLRTALEMRAKLVVEFPSVPVYQEELVNTCNGLGLLLQSMGQWDTAESTFRSGLTAQSKLADQHPFVPQYRRRLAISHINLGVLFHQSGRRADAEGSYRAALKIQTRLTDEFPGLPECRHELAMSHNNLGILLRDLGRSDDAEAAYRAAVAIRTRLVSDFPAVPGYRSELAGNYFNLGNLLRTRGRMEEAEAAYRSDLAIQADLARDFPDMPEYRRHLARSHNALGVLLSGMGRRDDAETAYRAALSIRSKLASEHRGIPNYLLELAEGHKNLGILFRSLGRWNDAIAAYRSALDIREKVGAEFPKVPRKTLQIISTRLELAVLLAQSGQIAESVAITQAMAADPSISADDLSMCSWVYSLLSGLENNPDANKHAARSIQLLGQSLAKGYRDFNHTLTDPDLAPIRSRDDFHDLLWQWADVPSKP